MPDHPRPHLARFWQLVPRSRAAARLFATSCQKVAPRGDDFRPDCRSTRVKDGQRRTMSLPTVVSREEWLVARKALLAKEKELTRARDVLNAERRLLPMVRIDKEYLFEGPDGKATLLDLFDGRRQLIVAHFMFDPSW